MQVRIVVAMDMSLELLMHESWDRTRDATAAMLALIRQAGHPEPDLLGYSDRARELPSGGLEGLHVDYVYGTNVQDVLRLGRSKRPDRILLVADAAASAHLHEGGDPFFFYPPLPETADRTVDEAQRCGSDGVRIDILLVRADSAFRPLARQLVALCGGELGDMAETTAPMEGVQHFLSRVGIA